MDSIKPYTGRLIQGQFRSELQDWYRAEDVEALRTRLGEVEADVKFWQRAHKDAVEARVKTEEQLTLASQQLADAETERDDADTHIALCQQQLDALGTPAGATGDLSLGISRLAEQRDLARQENERLRSHTSEEGTACANCHDPSHAILEQQRDLARQELAGARETLKVASRWFAQLNRMSQYDEGMSITSIRQLIHRTLYPNDKTTKEPAGG